MDGVGYSQYIAVPLCCYFFLTFLLYSRVVSPQAIFFFFNIHLFQHGVFQQAIAGNLLCHRAPSSPPPPLTLVLPLMFSTLSSNPTPFLAFSALF